jgi:glutathione S-transferase
MKLYYVPGTCSLSPHIVLRESGLPFEAVQVNPKNHQLLDGTDYYAINPLGYVPMLELADGTRLREGAVIAQYTADQAPQRNLAPANGTLARYRLLEWLNFIATEVHKGGFGPLFNPAAPDVFKAVVKERLLARLKWVNSELAGKNYLMGENFTVADAYLFTATTWAAPTNLDISGLANLNAFRTRIAARPAVQEAMKAEGLLG